MTCRFLRLSPPHPSFPLFPHFQTRKTTPTSPLSPTPIEAEKPTQNPEIPKNGAFTRTLSKSSRELFALVAVTRAKSPTEVVADELVHMSFLILVGFFRVDFPPLTPTPSPRNTNGNCDCFAKTTPEKNYPLVSATDVLRGFAEGVSRTVSPRFFL